MSEHDLYNEEFPQVPEHKSVPEHSALPEYNPVYPDITFFKESSVTCREENIFQGHPPEGESSYSDKRETRQKRERYSILRTLLGSASRGGAAVLCMLAVVALLASDTNIFRGKPVLRIEDAFNRAKKPAFTQQTGYDYSDFSKLWNGDPDAPHKYDTDHPLITLAASCTKDGEIEYVCLECGVCLHEILPAAGHRPGDAQKQDEIEASCTEDGSYREIVQCSVCGETLSDQTVTVPRTGHTPGALSRVDEIAATCTEGGSYTEIVSCSVCGKEISRTVVTTDAVGHTAAAAVRENEKAASCTQGGRYDSVVYCSVCGEEISRTTSRSSALGHTAGNAVRENEADATCTEAGHYDSVVYCSRCGEEISRTTSRSSALGHTAGNAVRENEADATCTEAGHYDSVVYCSRCGEQLSSDTVSLPALGHTAGNPVSENQVLLDCTKGGSYERVTTCSVCGEELSRETVDIAPVDHTAGNTEKAWISGREDSSGTITGPDCLDGGSYEEITYCSVCGQEMMRSEEVWVEPPGHSFSTSPSSGEILACSRCGLTFLDTFYSNNYVYFSFDTDYMEEAGLEYETVKLWSYSASAYVDEGGYEYGSDGSMLIPEEYRNTGERFRVDFYFTNGKYVSSYDVTYE